jgi:hypothetical protein
MGKQNCQVWHFGRRMTDIQLVRGCCDMNDLEQDRVMYGQELRHGVTVIEPLIHFGHSLNTNLQLT